MLAGLQNEIDLHPDLTGAAPRIVMQKLNADGSAQLETWEKVPLEDRKIKLSKLTLLTYLTPEQRTGIRAMLEGTSDAEKDFAMLYNSDNEFWVNDSTFRAMVDMLGTTLPLPAETVTTIKRLGERSISRAEELFGRKLTEGDF